jgi:hypothetical protein
LREKKEEDRNDSFFGVEEVELLAGASRRKEKWSKCSEKGVISCHIQGLQGEVGGF